MAIIIIKVYCHEPVCQADWRFYASKYGIEYCC